MLAGAAVAGAGIGLAIYGLRRKFASHLRTEQMSPAVRTVITWLGVAGSLTRGAVFCVAGAYLIDAALSFDPAQGAGA